MKCINVLSLVQARESLDKDVYNKYLNHFEICLKNEEIDDLNSLLKNSNNSNNNNYNGFLVGYKIPQIGKEFDLLRLGNESIINLELKSKCTREIIIN